MPSIHWKHPNKMSTTCDLLLYLQIGIAKLYLTKQTWLWIICLVISTIHRGNSLFYKVTNVYRQRGPLSRSLTNPSSELSLETVDLASSGNYLILLNLNSPPKFLFPRLRQNPCWTNPRERTKSNWPHEGRTETNKIIAF